MKKFIAAAALCLTAATAQAATVNNGSFDLTAAETSALNKNGWGLFDSIDGWTASVGQIEVQTEKTLGITAPEGDTYVELDATSNATIYQDIALAAGDYLLSFFYRPRVDGTGLDTNDMIYGTNTSGGDVVFSQNILGAPNDQYPHDEWSFVQYSFNIAADDTYRLFFSALGETPTSGCGNCGALIDNVQILGDTSVVNEVPLPASGLMLLAGVGALAARSRKKA